MTASYGRVIAQLAEPDEDVPAELIDLINSNVRPPAKVSTADVYIRAMYVVSDQVNSFGGRFPVDEHQTVARLLVDSPVLVGHRKDKLPVGRNFHAVTIERDQRPWVKSYFYSGPQIDTVRGYQFDPGTPSSPGLCRVFGYLFTSEGVAESGARISAWLPSGVTRLENLIISPTPVSATTDEYGYFYLDLIPSSLLNGEPKYEITINRTDGTILRKRLTVPDTAQWQLAW